MPWHASCPCQGLRCLRAPTPPQGVHFVFPGLLERNITYQENHTVLIYANVIGKYLQKCHHTTYLVTCATGPPWHVCDSVPQESKQHEPRLCLQMVSRRVWHSHVPYVPECISLLLAPHMSPCVLCPPMSYVSYPVAWPSWCPLVCPCVPCPTMSSGTSTRISKDTCPHISPGIPTHLSPWVGALLCAWVLQHPMTLEMGSPHVPKYTNILITPEWCPLVS